MPLISIHILLKSALTVKESKHSPKRKNKNKITTLSPRNIMKLSVFLKLRYLGPKPKVASTSGMPVLLALKLQKCHKALIPIGRPYCQPSTELSASRKPHRASGGK